jgi:hypothetical protein
MVGRQGWGVVLQSQANPKRSLMDAIGLRRLSGWLERSRRAMLADFEPVDSGSLEVLLYCTDDLAIRGEVPSRVIDRVHDR